MTSESEVDPLDFPHFGEAVKVVFQSCERGDGLRELVRRDTREDVIARQKDVVHLQAHEARAVTRDVMHAVAGTDRVPVAEAAVGGGLGLAMIADFRVTCPEARFSANFTRLGFHPGFGLTVTLPAVIGPAKAALMFYTSRRFDGDEAHAMGLADVLVPQDQVRTASLSLAAEIAENSPLGLIATRATLRGNLADRVRAATEHELVEQTRLRKTEDFKEGVKAMAERRLPIFTGR